VVGSSKLDRWQARAAERWSREAAKVWVTGGGKTFLAAQLIFRSLVAGRPVLVIAPDEGRLEDLQRELTALALDDYVFHYDASPACRSQLADLFANYRPGKPAAPPAYQPPRLPAWQWRQQVHRNRAIARPVFDRYPASVVLGLLLEANRKGGELVLDDQVGTDDFQFTGGEYFEMRDLLEQTQAIYRRLDLGLAGLENLHTGIFLHQTEAESQQFIAEHLARFTKWANELYETYLRVTARFEKEEAQRLAQQELRLRAAADRVARALAAWEDIGRTERGGVPAWRWFFQRRWGRVARQKREAWQQVKQRWQELRRLHRELECFTVANWDLPAMSAAVYDRLDQYGQGLDRWRSRIPEWVRDELTRLNASTLHPDLVHLRPALRRAEQESERLIASVNESGLYQLPLRADRLTSLRQRKFLEQLLEQFSHTQRHLNYYRDFYRWQRHWFGLPARLRRVTRRLLTLPGKDWPALFTSWYFEQCLRRSELPWPAAEQADPAILEALQTAERDHLALRPWVRERAARWKPVATEDYKAFWRNRPRGLLDRFPVWLTTPEGAAHLVLGNVRFPDLIVDNADGMDPADWDVPHQRLLVTAATEAPKGYASIRLEGCYRNGPLQPLFVGGGLGELPGEVISCTPADVVSRMRGRYQALREAETTEYRTAITALNESTFRELQSAGLPAGVVRSPRELPGTSLDRLLIYAPREITPGDSISPALLIDILLAARQNLFLFTSATDQELSGELITDGLSVPFVWAAAIRYIRYRHAADTAAAAAIANEVQTRLQLRRPAEHPLLREIARALGVLDERLTCAFDQPWRTLVLPLVVSLPNERSVVVLPEEGWAESAPDNPAFHWQSIAALEGAGYRVTVVDTLAWWRDPEAAARDLLAQWKEA
jgi:hypothetical protein